MSATYLGELYESIRSANPLVAALALGIAKREAIGDEAGAQERREQFKSNYGQDCYEKLEICVLYHLLYTVG